MYFIRLIILVQLLLIIIIMPHVIDLIIFTNNNIKFIIKYACVVIIYCVTHNRLEISITVIN